MANKNISDIVEHTLRAKRVEPQQRMVGGRVGWAIHRFPIKGGVSVVSAMQSNVTASNALYKRYCEHVRKNGGKP